ncbi:5'/3'-nucleotidase SurE [Streptomyces sp. NPDC102381]|uniref:5'/3'-nucleotidase SurE n=1 Tax=Streptomyces sp. NPDC102381 TaxID=3366164 RepID=UPI00381A9128
MMKRSVRATVCVAVVAATAFVMGPAGAAPASGPEASRPLNILLTNDDGWRGTGGADTPYIVVLRDALRAAGHHVVVAAPGTDQSGQGGRVSSRGQKLQVAEPEKDVWTVTPGSPSDSVYFGMDELFPNGKPDLVVAGINPGFNFGALVNHSGTFNAALTGVEFGVPALAMSLETQPDWPAGTRLAARPAASYVVDLIERLKARSRDDSRLMPRGIGLNINYPLVEGPTDPTTGDPRLATPKGTEPTTIQGGAFLVPDFTPDNDNPGSPGTYTMGYGTVDTSADAGSDIKAITDDYVSMSALQDDHDVDGGTEGWLRGLARGMR